MAASSKIPYIVGNWKMYKTGPEAVQFIQQLLPHIPTSATVSLAVPFTAIAPCVQEAEGSSLKIGAQNMSDASEGAFTGEIAGRMLKEAGATFVLLGHSERRQVFQETNAFIQKKVKQALNENLLPILCIGETREEKEEGKTEEVLSSQINECLEGISLKDKEALIVAYEPVWAIGTGDPATAEIAQERHAFCRQIMTNLFGKQQAKKITILYGGSVKPENAASFMQQKDVGGLLVGGASLSADTFSQIIKNAVSEENLG